MRVPDDRYSGGYAVHCHVPMGIPAEQIVVEMTGELHFVLYIEVKLFTIETRCLQVNT